MAADILLSFGVATSDADVSEIQKGLQTIIKKIEKDPPQVRVGLTVDDDALKSFKTKLEGVLKTLSLANGAPISLKIDGLGEITSEAAKATKALGTVEAAAEEVAEDTRAAFKDATRAVKEYYAALTKLAKQKTDIFLDGAEYKSASGNYAELAKELNRTKTAFDAVEKARTSMDSEYQVRLQTQMTQEATKYNRVLEEQANKERLATEAARARAAAEQSKADAAREKADTAEEARKEAEAFKDATRAVKEYYAALTKWAKSGEDGKSDIFYSGSEYRSQSGNYSELATELTRTKIAYDAVTASKAKLTAESRSRLTALETQELRAYNLALENRANKERLAADAAQTAYAQTQRLNTLISQNEANLRKWTSAKNGATASDYSAIQSAVEEWKQMRSQIASTGEAMLDFDGRIEKTTADVAKHSTAIKDANRDVQSFGDRFGSLAGKFASWLTVSQTIMFALQTMKKMVTTVIELDDAMTELKKVTDETDAAYEGFLTNASTRARELGATLADVVNATADFSRLGYAVDEASAMADAAIVYKNVGDGIYDVTEASESLISTMQAFGVEATNIMSIVDKFNNVGNRYAISSKGIGDALLNSASAMAAAGNTLDETIALITAANTTIQSPDKVGTALRSVSMYIRAAKQEAEAAGIATDGMAASVSELRDQILSLTKGKVDIMISDTEFKSTYQIIKEISTVWDSLKGTEQSLVAELLGGGVRNFNIIASLIRNFQIAEDSLADSMDSAGSALRENEVYLDSISGKISKFQSAWETLSATVVDSGFVKGIVDLGTALLDALNWLMELIEGFGGLNIALSVAIASIVNFGLAKNSISGLSESVKKLAGGAKRCSQEYARHTVMVTSNERLMP